MKLANAKLARQLRLKTVEKNRYLDFENG